LVESLTMPQLPVCPAIRILMFAPLCAPQAFIARVSSLVPPPAIGELAGLT